MTIMSAQDVAEITRIRAEMRADRPASIVLRRGETTLAAQTVRIARLSRDYRYNTEAAGERRARVLVSGTTTLDATLEDRFNYNGDLYRVCFVRPNQDTGTQVEAELVE